MTTVTYKNGYIYTNDRKIEACNKGVREFCDQFGFNIDGEVRLSTLTGLLPKCTSTQREVINALTVDVHKYQATQYTNSEVRDLIKVRKLEWVCEQVYSMLKSRQIHPSGEFDKQGRWYADHQDLINVRSPSRAWPYSQMTACRTRIYVMRVALYYNIRTNDDDPIKRLKNGV